MKKTISTAIAIVLAMLVISLISRGQATIKNLRFSDGNSSVQNAVSKAATITLHRSDVNSKAARDFGKSYKHVSDENWYVAPDAFCASFTADDIKYRVDYDKKGHWLHTIRTYDENKLPRDIRHLVKSSYYDYDITFVQEIEKPSKNFTYIVHLEGKTTLINLRVYDGEMEEWQKFEKSK